MQVPGEAEVESGAADVLGRERAVRRVIERGAARAVQQQHVPAAVGGRAEAVQRPGGQRHAAPPRDPPHRRAADVDALERVRRPSTVTFAPNGARSNGPPGDNGSWLPATITTGRPARSSRSATQRIVSGVTCSSSHRSPPIVTRSTLARPGELKTAVERTAQPGTPRTRRLDLHADERPVEVHVGDVQKAHTSRVGRNRSDLTAPGVSSGDRRLRRRWTHRRRTRLPGRDRAGEEQRDAATSATTASAARSAGEPRLAVLVDDRARRSSPVTPASSSAASRSLSERNGTPLASSVLAAG